jgi:hypothetical protein
VYDDVALVNYSSVPLAISLTATDGEQTAGGGFGLLPPGAKPTAVGAWISLSSGTPPITVPPKTSSGSPGQVVVPFTLQVPFKTDPGDYVGAFVASLRTIGQNKSGQQIILNQRVGTRVYVQVSGPLAARLVVSNLRASYRPSLNPFGEGSAVVTYTIRNAGNVNLKVNQAIGVSQVIGSTRVAHAPNIPLLLPGGSVAERIVVDGVWPQFLLSASVTAQGRTPTVSGVAPISTSATATFWAIPWPLIVLIVVIVLTVYLIRRHRQRRRLRLEAAASAAAAGAGGESDEADEASDDGDGGDPAGDKANETSDDGDSGVRGSDAADDAPDDAGEEEPTGDESEEDDS